MYEHATPSLEVKIGENRDTTLIDLLEDESLFDMLLERQHIKESVMEAVGKPDMRGDGGDALWHRTQPMGRCR